MADKVTTTGMKNYRADIDGLRALAVVSVVVFHAFPSLIPGGFVGVDVFFVISGFLITRILLGEMKEGRIYFASFYARRIRRIFPAVFLVLLSSLVLGWITLFSDEYKELGKHISLGAVFSNNFGLYFESGYFDRSATTKPLLHLWSLAVEEQFYLFWPLFITVAFRANRKVFLFVIIVTLISFLMQIYLVSTNLSAAFYMPWSRLWQLAIGGALAAYYANNQAPAVHVFFNKNLILLRDGLSVLGFLLIGIGFFLFNSHGVYPGFRALLPTLGAVMVIAAGTGACVNRHILSQSALVFIGLVSYPFYLWHWPLLSFARIIRGGELSILTTVLIVLLSFALSVFTYFFIEKPLRHKRSATLWLIAVMAFIGAVGLYVFTNDGLENRSGIMLIGQNKREMVRLPMQDEECLKHIGLDKAIFPYCRFNHQSGAKKTIAIIGDSHAHVAFPGIAALSLTEPVNTILLANSGCPPFIGAYYGRTEQDKISCREKVEKILSFVEGNKDVEIVLIFSRGVFYTSGKDYNEINNGLMANPHIESNLFYSGMQKTFDRLTYSGKKVFYVLENPELVLPPDACLERPFRPIAQRCHPTRVEVLIRQSSYRDRVVEMQNVKVIDPLPAFCPQHECIVFENNRLLYSDSDHLSVSGSAFQAKTLIKPVLEKHFGQK